MGLGMGIAARWMPVLERGGFSPIPFFYVMGGSLVFLFLTWHIPSVASAMMAGAVHLSYPVLGFTALVSLLTALACGLAPALEGSRADVHDAIKDGARQAGAGVRHRRPDLLGITY